jgi:hypothetical protein
MTRLALFGLAAAVAVAAPRADAALCRTKSGALFVRDACHRKETAVPLPKGDAGAPGVSTPRVRAFDSTGKLIGFVDGIGHAVFIHEGIALYLNPMVDGFLKAGQIYYEALDCLSAPLMAPEGAYYSAVLLVGADAYYPGSPIELRGVRSSLMQLDPTSCATLMGTYNASNGTCCSNFGSTYMQRAAPALPFDLSGFTPPFHVEIER